MKLGGVNMLEVTDAAYEKISEFFKDKDPKPIRVLLNPGG
jgi:Fe-S cluster assembly iron-binding protein IscA